MNKAAMLSFSQQGKELSDRIETLLSADFETVCIQPAGRLRETVESLFAECDAIVFVGACGIAVRAIAPFVVSKVTDPAVLVVDECGNHVISLLSGHIGGANRLTRRIAGGIGADPVITTATDVNDRFSVDAWASEQGFAIGSMDLARSFSAEILKRDLPVYSELLIEGPLPPGLYVSASGNLGAAITVRKASPYRQTLQIIPKILHIGIGCRRDTSAEKISLAVRETLEMEHLDMRAVCSAASIDLKSDEQGLLKFANESDLTFQFYTAQQLQQAEGDFSASSFVQETVGVDNVCERAAVLSAGTGAQLIVRKMAKDGVTVAVAQENRRIRFE